MNKEDKDKEKLKVSNPIFREDIDDHKASKEASNWSTLDEKRKEATKSWLHKIFRF